MRDGTQITEAPRPVPGSHSSKFRSEPLGPALHPLSDVDGSLPTLPARGRQDHAVFAIVSLPSRSHPTLVDEASMALDRAMTSKHDAKRFRSIWNLSANA